MQQLTHRVTYTKHFHTGLLAGLSVNCGFTVPVEDCPSTQARLNAVTDDEPHWDTVGDRYHITNVRCCQAS